LCESDVAQLLERIGFQPTFAAAAAPSLNERAAGSPLWLGAMLRVLVSNREQLESTTNGWRLPTARRSTTSSCRPRSRRRCCTRSAS
jgi:hypothetical protein